MLGCIGSPNNLVTLLFARAQGESFIRVVWDCRVVSATFKQPPPLPMPFGFSWSRITMPRDSILYTVQSDVKHCFYSIAIDDDLGSHFCLPPLPAEFWKSVGHDITGEAAWPFLRRVPMGWN